MRVNPNLWERELMEKPKKGLPAGVKIVGVSRVDVNSATPKMRARKAATDGYTSSSSDLTAVSIERGGASRTFGGS